MRKVMILLQLLKDLKVPFDVIDTPLNVYCEAFEDNQSCIAVTESKKPPTRTKHIAIKCHHFRSLVGNKDIRIKHVDTKQQVADMLTKPIDDNQFFKLRHMLMSW